MATNHGVMAEAAQDTTPPAPLARRGLDSGRLGQDRERDGAVGVLEHDREPVFVRGV